MNSTLSLKVVAMASLMAIYGGALLTAAPVYADCSKKTSGEKQMQTTLTKDIVETAQNAGSFNTLVTALTEAGLVDTLKGAGPFTVFAPSDEAFKKVPQADLEALLKDKAKLTKVLTYHVVSGSLKAEDVVKHASAKSLEGADIAIKTGAEGVTVAGAKVVQTDILCSNGVVHVIVTVIFPPAI
jgi:uncharacterized surface protein with fasciclin (FAS1) repeats